ncbi:MAG: hypothetical protein OEP95_06415 [Myxococcales bacterium]|nr:hypothetical protein [Myxococcales bacterium]
MIGVKLRCTFLTVALALATAGCRITPERIQVIETENELLREEISILKERCEQSRELDLRLDEDDAKAPAGGS